MLGFGQPYTNNAHVINLRLRYPKMRARFLV
jgi:hypothetical protein